MSNCNDCQMGIQRYVGEDLEPEQRDILFSHIKHCQSCRDFLEQERELSIRIRKARPSITAPDSLRSTVEQRVREHQSIPNDQALLR